MLKPSHLYFLSSQFNEGGAKVTFAIMPGSRCYQYVHVNGVEIKMLTK
jgi:hypothetical protein